MGLVRKNPIGLGNKVAATLAKTFLATAQRLSDWLEIRIMRAQLRFGDEQGKVIGNWIYSHFENVAHLEELPDDVKVMFKELARTKHQFTDIIKGNIISTGVGSALGFALAVAFRPLRYQVNKFAPNVVLTPAELVRLQRMKIIDPEEAAEEALFTGVNRRRYSQLYRGTERLLREEDLRTLLHRGKIGWGDIRHRLERLGYERVSTELLQEVFWFYPSPTDVVRFAVREAFSDEAARDYQLDADRPPDFPIWAAKVGLHPDVVKFYWRAHWRLPSVEQGYEMLHRGKISREELAKLMKYLDIMPGWRDKLIDISYRPYTRVDVRRMYRVGVLDQAGVKRAYLDLGYDEEKAENMTRFTIAWSTATERDLTKSDILDGFRRRLIPEREARDLLLKMGYSEAEANFYIARTKQKVIEQKRKQILTNVKRRFERGIINAAEATERLLQEGFTREEIEEQLDLWIRTRGERVFTPPLGDLKAFFKEGIIDKDTFTQEMINRGCSQRYINWYIDLLKGGA